jgi:hypothetical protein
LLLLLVRVLLLLEPASCRQAGSRESQARHQSSAAGLLLTDHHPNSAESVMKASLK